MKGYYNDEEQTKAAIDEEGWFHTGDIGEITAEGQLKMMGAPSRVEQKQLDELHIALTGEREE